MSNSRMDCLDGHVHNHHQVCDDKFYNFLRVQNKLGITYMSIIATKTLSCYVLAVRSTRYKVIANHQQGT